MSYFKFFFLSRFILHTPYSKLQNIPLPERRLVFFIPLRQHGFTSHPFPHRS